MACSREGTTSAFITWASMPWYDDQHWLACAQRTCDGPRDNTVASTARYALLGDGLAFLGDSCEGDRLLVPRGGGTGFALTPRRCGALRAAQDKSAGRLARRGRFRARPDCFQPVNPLLTAVFAKKLNCATKTVDTKVVDETSLYNICKGCPMFFSTV
jgi:hypothetical protein